MSKTGHNYPVEKTITIQFSTEEKTPQLPQFFFELKNNSKIKAYFDTGSLGTIEFPDSILSKLINEDIVNIYSRNVLQGYIKPGLVNYSVKSIYYNQNPIKVENLLHYNNDDNQISLGYSFLKNYISIWDYENKIITLVQE